MPKRPYSVRTSSGRGVKRRKSRKRRYARPKALALKMHNFVERTAPALISVANESTASGLFRNYTLSQCLQVSHYKELFEYYKINKVVVTFRYKGSSLPAFAGAAGNANQIINEINPVLYFKIDHNDDTADTLNTLKESMRTRTHQFTNAKPEFSIQLKPAILAESYKTAISSCYAPKWNTWLSTSDDTVPHYGLKAYAIADTLAGTNAGQMEVTTKIYFSAKCNE